MLSEAEFIEGVREHENIIWKVISVYLDNPDEHEDLRQEILLNAWKGIRTFRGESKFSTWLYRVALNTAITFYKKDKKHQGVHKSMPDNFVEPVDEPADHENRLAMNEAIDRLSTIDKAVVMLYLDDYSYPEIADMLGITVNNLAVKMNRIKWRLKQKIV
ncbi:MAG: RNA polymerase sigma factor [Chitinophagaceae bacterium]